MPLWLITGCSSGFGKEIAHYAIKKGDKVIATCRRDASRISDLKEAGATILELDISAPYEVHQQFANTVLDLPIVKSNGGVDILVHNAGYVQMGAAEEVSEEEFKRCYQTNFFGHVNLTRAMLPQFRSRKSGTIAFIGSIAGFMAIPDISAYSCAKFAMAGYAEILSAELQTFNITVTCIEPGHFRTLVFKGRQFYPKTAIDAYKDTVVGEMRNALVPALEQPGDAVVGSHRIVDLLRGDWPEHLKTEGRKLPVRIALGDDAHQLVEDWFHNRLKENEEWKEWICGTNFK